MNFTNLFASLFLCGNNKNDTKSPPIVDTCYGKVQGFTALNGSLNVFFGIPYARAPNRPELRFEKPQRPEEWKGIRPAVDLPSCYPHATPDWLNDFLQQGNLSEDCLRLNIFTPHENRRNRANKLLPVLVLIHGGGFEMGSSVQFSNYTDIGTNFVQHGIVVVSVQYRLGQMGFATTGDDVLPGNLGLWDQLAALEYVKDNIVQFGGNPRQITLLGQSAGSASVSALSLSPHSRNLFQRAIQLSSSSLSSFVRGSRVANETLKLARALDCPVSSSLAIKQCLQSKEPEQLLRAVDKMGSTRVEPNCILFGPHVDGDFFPEDPQELIQKAPKKPTLAGFNQLEWILLTLLLGRNSTLSQQMLPASQIGIYGAADFMSYIDDHVATGQRFGNAQAKVGKEIFDFYANGTGQGQRQSQQNNNTFFIRQYTQLISDLLITLPVVSEVRQKTARGWPLFLYIHAYVNEAGFPPQFPIKESYHINDMNYVFYNPVITFSFNEQDKAIQAFMQQAFRNFIKAGNPSSGSIQWPQVRNADGKLAHIRIEAPAPSVQSNAADFVGRLQFWEQLAEEYPQYDVLREVSGAEEDNDDE